MNTLATCYTWGMSRAKGKEQWAKRGVGVRAASSKHTPQIRDRSNRSHLPSLMVAIVLAVVPFHAFLTVWASTGLGNYTLLRLWPETIILALVAWLLWSRQVGKTWHALGKSRLAWPIAIYLGVNGLYFIVTILWGDAGLHAASYGLLLNIRHVAWFVVAYAVARNSAWLSHHWQRLLIWPLVVVSVFAVLQFFVLPSDVLKHFGYIKDVTITPVQTINQDTSTIRVQSFLRGANPLGAYLVLTVSLVLAATIRRWQKIGLALVSIVAMIVSFSRSAWLGLVVALSAQAAATRGLVRGRRVVLSLLIALLMALVGAIFVLHSNQGFKTAFLHVNDHSTAPQTSNEGRLAALKEGINDVTHEPFGRGVGTSGPASVYHAEDKSRNSENYFLSLGQETGWLSLGVFVLICYRLAVLLYRTKTAFPRALFASFVGLTLVNFLSYAWSDTTLVYLWWGLAAIAIAAFDNSHLSFTKKSANSTNEN